jgi:hypothetical protein
VAAEAFVEEKAAVGWYRFSSDVTAHWASDVGDDIFHD